MTLQAVLDVTILAAAGVKPGGTPARIDTFAARRRFELVLSDHIVTTIINVPSRPYFAKLAEPAEQLEFVRSLQVVAVVVVPDPSVSGVCDDDEDDLVLGTAVAAKAAYPVTGDQGLLRVGEYQGVRIIGAAGFLDARRDELEVER